MIFRVAASMLATVATCGCARANIVLSCSGTMEGAGTPAKQVDLSISIDSVRKTVTVGDAAPISFQSDATNSTITFGSATSPTFGILNKVTGAIFVSTFQPVTTFRGVCSQIAK
jgi:hypothetical protein